MIIAIGGLVVFVAGAVSALALTAWARRIEERGRGMEVRQYDQ